MDKEIPRAFKALIDEAHVNMIGGAGHIQDEARDAYARLVVIMQFMRKVVDDRDDCVSPGMKRRAAELMDTPL